MSDDDIDAIDKAAQQVIAIGKAIEHTKKQTTKASKKTELAKQFLKALTEIEEEKENALSSLAKAQKKDPLWKKMLKKLTDKFLKAKEGKEKGKGEEGGSVLAGRDSVKSISADLEVAVVQLRSTSRLDTDRNDLAMIQKMEKVMELSSKLASKLMTSGHKGPSLAVQKAGIAIADISPTFKNNSSSVMVTEEANKKREVATGTGMDKADLSTSMIEALKTHSGAEVSSKDVPMTHAAKIRKEREATEFSSYTSPSRRAGGA